MGVSTQETTLKLSLTWSLWVSGGKGHQEIVEDECTIMGVDAFFQQSELVAFIASLGSL